MEKALVVFSGGQDSTICLYWAKKNFEQVKAIAFDYGQRHISELNAAKDIAMSAGVELFLFPLQTMKEVSPNVLTNNEIMIEWQMPEINPPNTLVEGRNMLFLTYAAIFAKAHGIPNLVTGVGQTDYSGYPDCREEFIVSLNQTLNLAMDYPFKLHTPLMRKDKAEAWQMAEELGIFDLVRYKTVTCYNGVPGDGCGKCPSCLLRNKGLTKYLNSKKEATS
jgi:7-cyano-7-deazaguanine synthase